MGEPSPFFHREHLNKPSWARRSRAAAAKSGRDSIAMTSRASSDRIAAWYPESAPTSKTRSEPSRESASAMAATMNGCEMVWPPPIGKRFIRIGLGGLRMETKRWRGTSAMASSTRCEQIPRSRICRATISRRADSKLFERPGQEIAIDRFHSCFAEAIIARRELATATAA